MKKVYFEPQIILKRIKPESNLLGLSPDGDGYKQTINENEESTDEDGRAKSNFSVWSDDSEEEY